MNVNKDSVLYDILEYDIELPASPVIECSKHDFIISPLCEEGVIAPFFDAGNFDIKYYNFATLTGFYKSKNRNRRVKDAPLNSIICESPFIFDESFNRKTMISAGLHALTYHNRSWVSI